MFRTKGIVPHLNLAWDKKFGAMAPTPLSFKTRGGGGGGCRVQGPGPTAPPGGGPTTNTHSFAIGRSGTSQTAAMQRLLDLPRRPFAEFTFNRKL